MVEALMLFSEKITLAINHALEPTPLALGMLRTSVEAHRIVSGEKRVPSNSAEESLDVLHADIECTVLGLSSG